MGGLNLDLSDFLKQEGSFINLENVSLMIQEDGAVGEVKQSTGNTLIPSDEIPVLDYVIQATAEVIGAYHDKRNNRIYWWIYDSDRGNNAVLSYDIGLDRIFYLIHEGRTDGDWLGFNPEYRINGAAMFGDVLYWTDGLNPPRSINVERALNTFDLGYTNADAGTYTIPMREEDFLIIKRPPEFPMSANKFNASRTVNLVKDNSFQFAYRYIYKDGEISTLSPYSKIVNYNQDDVDNLDAVRISIPSKEVIPDTIDSIEILYRMGNTGSFKIYKILDSTDSIVTSHNVGVSITVDFYNEAYRNQVDDNESSKLFDDVPITSKTLAQANSRLFLGGNTYSYDQPEVDITFTANTQSNGGSITGQFVIGLDINADIIFVFILVSGAGGGLDGYYDTDILDEWSGTIANGNYPDIYQLTSDDAVLDSSNNIITTEAGLQTKYPLIDSFNLANPVTVVGLGSQVPYGDGLRVYKAGSQYQFGVVMFDKHGRTPGVYTDETMIISTAENGFNVDDLTTGIEWEIDTTTGYPNWVESFSIVRTRSLNISSFLQHYATTFAYVNRDDDDAYVFTDTDGTTFNSEDHEFLALDLTELVNDKQGYEYKAGDFIIIRNSDLSIDTRFEVRDTFGKWIILDGVIDLGSTGGPSDLNRILFYEIITPRALVGNNIFYEIGDKYGVTNGTLDVSDGTALGDSYVKQIDIDGGTAFVEVMNPRNDFYTDWLEDIGRPFVVTDLEQVLLPNTFSWSETYISGSKIRGVSKFSALDRYALEEVAGNIEKLVIASTTEVGSVLKALCLNNVFSIYLGQSRLVDESGQVLTASSGNVIGTVRALVGQYGCQNHESVAQIDGNVFFLDKARGKIIRDGASGMVPISDVGGVSSLLEDICDGSTGNFVGAFDQRRSQYLLSYEPYRDAVKLSYGDENTSPIYINNSIDSGFVLAYDEQYGLFSGTYSYKPEAIVSTGDRLFTFDTGNIYEDDGDSNTYFGQIFFTRVAFIGNLGIGMVKTLKWISTQAAQPPSRVYVEGVTGELKATDLSFFEFSLKEDVYYASIRRDRASPNGLNSFENIIKGFPMRDQAFKIGIEFRDLSIPIDMKAVTIGYNVSHGHRYR